MESSGGNYHHPGAQDEPFFDLLQQSAPISVPKTGYPNSSGYNAPKKMENSTDFNFGGDDVLPSFDFQPIRTTPASSSSNVSGGSASTAVRIEESSGRQGSPPASYTSYEPMVRRSREPPPTYETPVSRPQEHEKESFDSATAAAVERTMKKYADNLLRALEGMTGRLSQLESSTQRLEHLFEEIKSMVADTHVEADGKLRSLESHILEVHRGVQVLRDRQEIFEAQSQLEKLQLAKGESATVHSAPSAPPPPPPPPRASESPSQLSRASSGKALIEAPPQHQVPDTPSSSYYQPQQQLQLQQMPSLPPPPPQQPQPSPQQPLQQQPPPPLPPQHQHGLAQQHQVQPQQLQQPMQLQQPNVMQNEVSHQTLHQQQPPPPPPPPPQQSSLPPQHQPQPPHPPSPYSQQQQQQQQQLQPPYTQQQQPTSQPPPMPNYGHPPELPVYGQHPQVPHPPHHVPMPPSSYPSDLPSYHPSYGPPRPGLPPPQQQPPPSPQPQQPHNVGMYEPSMGRSGSGQLSLPAPPYLPQGLPVSGAAHYEPQGMVPGSGYPGSSYRVAQPVPSAPSGSSGGGGYPRLPVAQPLPHAMPTGGAGAGPPSSGNPSLSTNRVPIDEVIDKVTAMGFSKGQVRDVVRRLTENGQSVDLNIVLDKLMNGDTAQAPQKNWFNR